MTRTTVDYGIDLGTTTSAVAVLNGTEAEVVKNTTTLSDVTPSAVYVDKRGRIHVGQEARGRAETDSDNVAVEFKRRMGLRDQPWRFASSGRTMGPEELSAEVLKSLRADVRQRYDEDIHAAVITVPAAFELNQTDATRRAAELAGLRFAPLIQEPTAAAMAHGFQSDADNRFWLVYDLGGGTFDAAIVHLRDGELTVVGHRGDNHLGGQQIDWAIVEQLLIPAVQERVPIPHLARGVDRWRAAVAKLKVAAEQAKIALSRQDHADILIEDLFKGCPDGPDLELDHELRRADVERLAQPLYARTVNICRQALAEAQLEAGAVEKVLLVGGPTLAPQLRRLLADELGIALDLSQDPLTVVARGAAVFAGTQQIPHDGRPVRPGQYRIQLDYSPIGADTEPFVGGRVVGEGKPLPTGLAVELENVGAERPWRSGRVAVNDKGSFVTSLWAEKGRRNVFGIVLTDGTGERLDVTPDQLVYTCGAAESQPLLTHTIGLGLAGGELLEVLAKGTPLPAHQVAYLRTTAEVRPGSGTGMIRIPVLEGEHRRADRNRRVGTLEVRPADVARDVPVGTPVEVRIEVDASRLVRARAYVPLLEAEFDRVIDLTTETAPDPAELRQRAGEVRERYGEIEQKVRTHGDLQAQAELAELEREGLVDQVGALAERGAGDGDAATTGAKRVADLEARLDDVEAALRWPELVQEAEAVVTAARDVVDKAGNPGDRQTFAEREHNVREAITTGDADFLRQRIEDVRLLAVDIFDRIGVWPLDLFEHLKGRLHEMSDQTRARRLVNEGERALQTNEMAVLRNVNRQLGLLLPGGPGSDDPWSTVTRDR
jgi:molecular chaperone DnaK